MKLGHAWHSQEIYSKHLLNLRLILRKRLHMKYAHASYKREYTCFSKRYFVISAVTFQCRKYTPKWNLPYVCHNVSIFQGVLTKLFPIKFLCNHVLIFYCTRWLAKSTWQAMPQSSNIDFKLTLVPFNCYSSTLMYDDFACIGGICVLKSKHVLSTC